ncbi:MAG: hypothetical protein JXD22_16820 [Sedimentisphaerales bacterium]|nr:hypothetical protein [Sedimentisphaerales bacterium]
MKAINIILVIALLVFWAGDVFGQFRPFELKKKRPVNTKSSEEKQAEVVPEEENQAVLPNQNDKIQQKEVEPVSKIKSEKLPALNNPGNDVSTVFQAADIADWPEYQVGTDSCRVSPAINFGPRYELNLHRVSVTFSGSGTVEIGLAHDAEGDLNTALGKNHLHSPFQKVQSDLEIKIVSNYRGEHNAWIMLKISGSVKISQIRYTCWRGKDTLYGHVAGEFEFHQVKLPFRLMFPKNYDPKKKYPLVLSVHGSGGVGSDNVKNMEMVILGTSLFTRYYDDKSFECFSLVPQVLPQSAIPAPFWPKGTRGQPDRLFHPDWPIVNAEGWFVQGSLALIEEMIKDPRYSIDSDRVYYSGFSLGGKACWEFLKADPNIFAAAMCGAGWAMGRPVENPTGALLERLKQEVQIYKHIPTYIFVGEKDRLMLMGSRAVHKEILAQGGQSNYVEFPQTDHVATAGKAWTNPEYLEWLFRQKREKNKKVN